MEAKTAYDRELMDNLRATELRLGLPGTEEEERQKPACRGTKRPLPAEVDEEMRCRSPRSSTTCNGSSSSSDSTEEEEDCPEAAAPPAKAQVVGWPPVRTYRKNCLQARKATDQAEAPGLYVKVSMDGAPYLRKIGLNAFRGYKELREALEGMFKCFSIGFSVGEAQATSDYAITYEDKDGDWMLAGDVPWEMFTSSCRRLRIMKGTEARGFGSSS
ncbi:hypothetical protein Taro_023120 [Colocasia esculenta]|uniref:Auxin-responsive protein n=1 Tax=Colocasia esculenta TaxID=4460 RepID=A0A843V9Z2_COLES|nr:hypothetical protein [Colocasia esculenta]